MSQNSLKRGQLTERIGDAEHNRLPNKTPKNSTLAGQVEDKRQTLEKLLNRVSRSKRDLDKVDEDVLLLQNIKLVHKNERDVSKVVINNHNEDKKKMRSESMQLKRQLKEQKSENAKKEKNYQDLHTKAVTREAQHTNLQSTRYTGIEPRHDDEQDLEDAADSKTLTELENKLTNLRTQITTAKEEKSRRSNRAKPDTESALNGSLRSGPLKLGTAISHVRFGGQPEIEGLEEQLDNVSTEIDEKEKEWVAVQDQISKIETSRTELTAKHAAEHERLRHYQDRIDILELEPSTNETSKASTPKSQTRTRKSSMDSRSSSKNSRKSVPPLGTLTNRSKQFEIATKRSNAEESLKSDLSATSIAQEAVKNEVHSIEERVKAMTQEKEQLSHEVASSQRKMSLVKQKIEQIRHTQDTQRARLNEFTQEKEHEAQGDLKALEEEVKNLEEEWKTGNDEANGQNSKLATLYQRLTEVQKQHKTDTGTDLLGLNTEMVDWRNKVLWQEKEHDALAELVKEAKERNKRVKDDLTPVKPYFEVQAEYEALKERDKQLTAAIKANNVKKN